MFASIANPTIIITLFCEVISFSVRDMILYRYLKATVSQHGNFIRTKPKEGWEHKFCSEREWYRLNQKNK